LKLEFSVRK
jgi:hypothetical protein